LYKNREALYVLFVVPFVDELYFIGKKEHFIGYIFIFVDVKIHLMFLIQRPILFPSAFKKSLIHFRQVIVIPQLY